MKLSNEELLQILATDEGFQSVEHMLQHAVLDSVVPGICLFCLASIEVEPDCRNGYCDNCNKNKIVSCLVLQGII